MSEIDQFLQSAAQNSVGYNTSFQNAGDNTSGQSAFNAAYSGTPEPWNRFDAEQKKGLIDTMENVIRRAEQELRLPNDPERVRQHINKVLLSMIDKNKDSYADIKKELMELGVEAISDSFHFDDYYDEKYGAEYE